MPPIINFIFTSVILGILNFSIFFKEHVEQRSRVGQYSLTLRGPCERSVKVRGPSWVVQSP